MPGARAYIYCITNTLDEKRYIGITHDPARRWKRHLTLAKGASRAGARVHAAIRKYGAEVFVFEVIACSATWEDGLATERLLISALNTTVDGHGYNLMRSSEVTQIMTHSAETRAMLSAVLRGRAQPKSASHRAALSAAMMGRKPTAAVIAAGIAANTGRKLSEVTRMRMGAARQGHEVSEATRAKIGASTMGLKRSAATCEANRVGHLGIKHTPEQSAAKSARQTGKKLGPWSDERRAALSRAQKGKTRGPYSA